MVLCRYSYETGALLLADEAGVIAGLLVGLNVIDCNVAIKDDDLDQPVGGNQFHKTRLMLLIMCINCIVLI